MVADKDYLIYEYIDGDFILDFIKKSNKKSVKMVMRSILKQMLALDRLKTDKEEMHRPLKHIIISKNRPFLIDFERAHYAHKPKNVTQFCQFLISGHLANILQNKKIKIDKNRVMQLAKIYKNHQNIKNFKKIAELI